jgi:enoyl-CoA hydratase/carnithine racemase
MPEPVVHGDVVVTLDDDLVATVEIGRAPNNFFDVELVSSLADAYESLAGNDSCRAIVLCSEGKHFCAVVGQQHALELLYAGRRISGGEAFTMGLCDRLVEATALRTEARRFAAEIAASAPLAVRSMRATMRADLVRNVAAAMHHEAAEQNRLRQTDDWTEGVKAMSERRRPRFTGR